MSRELLAECPFEMIVFLRYLTYRVPKSISENQKVSCHLFRYWLASISQAFLWDCFSKRSDVFDTLDDKVQ